ELRHEVAAALAQRRELLREAVDELAGLELALLAHAAQRAALEDRAELVEALREVHAGVRRRLREGHREAPDLPALLLREVREGLDEAGDEVGLREEHVDRQRHLEAVLHLVDALARAARQRADLFVVRAAQLV